MSVYDFMLNRVEHEKSFITLGLVCHLCFSAVIFRCAGCGHFFLFCIFAKEDASLHRLQSVYDLDLTIFSMYMYRFVLISNILKSLCFNRASYNRGILKIILFLKETCCDPSLEPSWQEEFASYVFMEIYGKSSLNYVCYSFLSGILVCLRCHWLVWAAVLREFSIS